jgi:hypothetical protein
MLGNFLWLNFKQLWQCQINYPAMARSAFVAGVPHY